MASPILGELSNEVALTVGTMQSAEVFIDGTSERLERAVQEALRNGATAEELVPVTSFISEMKTQRDELAAAISRQPGEPVEPAEPEEPGEPLDPNNSSNETDGEGSSHRKGRRR